MKLTDEQIDKLFQEGAAKQSFAYKPEYWDEFSASLSDSTPLSEASDEALDTAFQESASNQSFDYKPEYWEAFAAGLNSTPLSQAPDDAFDAAFQDNASEISVDYKPEFWSEFNDSLSSIDATENVADPEIDALYREEVANLSFAYQPSYWEEMAAMLRRRRRRPEFLWFGLSGVFATALVTMLFLEQSPLQMVWDTPEYAFGEVNPDTNSTRTNNLASNTNNAAPTNNGGQTPVTNVHGNPQAVHNNPNAVANNGSATPNENGTEPNLTVNASNTSNSENKATSGGREETQTSQEAITEADALQPRTLESSELPFDNTLAALNAPRIPIYRGGVQSGLYVQGIAGLSESLIANSAALSSSYGFGLGWQMNHRKWTFNMGSNLIVSNHSDLLLSGEAFRHQGFGGALVRNDYEFSQIITTELDLAVAYNLGRHQFRAGIRPSFDISSFVIENQVVTVFDEDAQAEETISTSQGFNSELTGIQRFGLKPTFGYAYNFPSGWTLGLNMSTEVLPSVREDLDFVLGTNNTLPLDGQLYLRKTLNFRK